MSTEEKAACDEHREWLCGAHAHTGRRDIMAAGLQTKLEPHKLDKIKYLAGFVFRYLTEVLGFHHL